MSGPLAVSGGGKGTRTVADLNQSSAATNAKIADSQLQTARAYMSTFSVVELGRIIVAAALEFSGTRLDPA